MKKRKLTRIIAISLAMAMVFGGCGKKSVTDPKDVNENTPTTNPVVNEPVEITSELTGLEFIKTLPKLSEEKVEFTIVNALQPDQMDYNNMELFKAMEEATNVHINWECYDNASYSDQKNIMLASNDLPDAFFGYEALSMSDINAYGPMGMFIPVDDLIEKYGTNYKERLAQEPILDGLSTAFDGNKYTWGTVNASPSRDFPDNLYINKAWLDKLNLEIPTTMDEYYKVLEAFKTQDPNGNGIADEIPYTFVSFHHIQGYGSFFGAYGQAETFNGKSGNTMNHFVVVDDKVQFNPITEEYKNAIKSLKPFFEAGLFDNEGFVQDTSQFNAKVTAATPIVGSMYIWDLTALPEDVKEQYVAIQPLKASEESDSAYVRKRQNHISIQPTGFAITKECKNADILAQWIDLFYSDDMSVLSYAGLDCVRSVDGVFTYDESLSETGESLMTVAQRENPYDGSPKYLTQDMRDNLFPLKSGQTDKTDVISQYYSSAKNITLSLPSMNLTNEESDTVNSYGIDIQNYVDTNHCNWLLGKSDIDADWDSYLAQLENLQLEEYLTIMQTAYDRTAAK